MKIIFATDGSECSEDAAKFLTRFRFTPRDEIIILHVVSEIPYDDDYRAKLKHVIKKVAPKIINASMRALKPVGAKISSMEEEGPPDMTIIKVAVDSSADLIVMGARGLKGMKSLFLGSITRSVAINSPKPVLVTKPTPYGVSERMKLLFATDGSVYAHATAGLLASMPFPGDTEVFILNAAWSAASDIPERFLMEVDERVKEDVARARTIELERSERIVREARERLSTKFRNIHAIAKGGDPSMEILNEAEVLRPDLIALGSRGLRGLKGMLGSVSRRILGHARCPVLIGKTKED